jgi:hypothetical protein
MPETRKIREDLTKKEGAAAEYRSLTFKSIRRMDMLVEKFIPSA